jgi:Flp pilus assembly pilin Flp
MDRLLSLYLQAATRDREDGQTIIEYSLILAFIAIVALGLGTSGTLRDGVKSAFDAVAGLF